MEREMNPQRRVELVGSQPSDDGDMESTHENLEEMMRIADEIIDSIPHTDAEQYLQQSRQRGGQ